MIRKLSITLSIASIIISIVSILSFLRNLLRLLSTHGSASLKKQYILGMPTMYYFLERRG